MGSTTNASFGLTVYRGTFIQLPRLPDTGAVKAKPELVRNQGAFWVSATDGRIKGWDWQAHDDARFAELMTRNGWVDIDVDIDGQGSKTKVKIVTASEEKNEFFFPGFIGIYIPISIKNSITNKTRHTHPRPSIPKCWSLRLLHSTGLARDIYIPSGVRLRQPARPKNRLPTPNQSRRNPPGSPDNLRPSNLPHPLPRDNLRKLLCNNPHPSNKRLSNSLQKARAASLHRPSLHGQPRLLPKILSRLLSRGLSDRNESNNRPHPIHRPNRLPHKSDPNPPLRAFLHTARPRIPRCPRSFLLPASPYPDPHRGKHKRSHTCQRPLPRSGELCCRL
jgi:hypothetical protein